MHDPDTNPLINLNAAVKLKNDRHICPCFEIKQK